MGKPRPAHAGGSTTPAERLAEAEAALVGLTPDKRAAAELELDELRQAARVQAEQERQAALAEQEIVNHADSHAVVEDAEAPAAPAERAEGGE